MVTFIVILIFSVVLISFTIYFLIKKGKVLKRWYIAIGGIVLSGIICISIAIPVTSNIIEAEFNSFMELYLVRWYEVNEANYDFDQSTLAYMNEKVGKDVSIKNAWLKKQQNLISTGIYWDVSKTTREQIMEMSLIPYIIYENGEYTLILN